MFQVFAAYVVMENSVLKMLIVRVLSVRVEALSKVFVANEALETTARKTRIVKVVGAMALFGCLVNPSWDKVIRATNILIAPAVVARKIGGALAVANSHS